MNSSSRNVPERKAFDFFPMKIEEWKGERLYLSEEILKSLWADDYIDAAYERKSLFNQIRLFIPFYDYQGTRHASHAPQSCLLGGGWSLIRSDDHLIEVAPNHDIKMRTMTLVKDNSTLLSAYFFFQRGRVITNPWANKFYIMLDSLGKGRTDGALVRMEMLVAPGQSIEEAYGVLDEFASKVWPILPDYVPE